MKIPNNNQSLVADNKITDYLLSETHGKGKYKADFFKSFGFEISDIETFKASLIQHSKDRDIVEIKYSAFGKKYELKCAINTPDKRNPCVVTIWIIEVGQETPILVTAYPTN
jgi:filamentous hemagglutinin